MFGFTRLPFSSYIFITVEYLYSISLELSEKSAVFSICFFNSERLFAEMPFTMVDIISVITLLL